MTLACIIVAVLILIGALFTVAADARDDRDWHAANAEQLAAQLAVSNARLSEVLNAHAHCPVPYQRQRGEW